MDHLISRLPSVYGISAKICLGLPPGLVTENAFQWSDLAVVQMNLLSNTVVPWRIHYMKLRRVAWLWKPILKGFVREGS